MDREVTLAIKGLHSAEESDHVKVATETPAQYFKKNDSHYLLYEETVEGFDKISKNRIKFTDNCLELTRKGIVDTHMVFEEKKTHMTDYVTPYGKVLLGVRTEKIVVREWAERIQVTVEYVLEMDEKPLSECRMTIEVKERKKPVI